MMLGRTTLLLIASLVLVSPACSESTSRSDSDGSAPDSAASDQGSVDGALGDAEARDAAARDGSPADSGVNADSAGPDATCPGGGSDGSLPSGTIAGAVTTPHPTLRNITVEWAIQGDDDLDSTVRVRYRVAGGPWRRGMDLRRIPAASNEGFSWSNRHSGSVFGLEPGTSYELELWLRDPDGGCRVENVTVTTRPLPAPMVGATVRSATPSTLQAALAAAAAGDIVELAAGTYGAFSVSNNGAPGKPLVIRSSQGAVVNGMVNISDREYVHVVGLTANRIRFDRSKRVAIMGNTVNLVGKFDGIGAWKRAEDAYIADNVVKGTTTWNEAALGASGANVGECIIVTGPGHVITHNKVSGCRDNISFFEGAGAAVDQYSIDVTYNDIDAAADDGVEADFCEHNCRIMNNRFTNVFIAMSSQPGLGGPTYFIRNVVYSNVFNAAFKLNRGSIGDVVLHNTIVKIGDALAGTPGRDHERQLFRNNVFIGGAGGTYGGWFSGSGRIVHLPYAAANGSYDYDGLGSLVGNDSGTVGKVKFATFSELRSKTSYKHAVQVNLSIFAATVDFPANPFPAKTAPDLRLAPGSAAVDKGLVILGINDGYAGAAPDLGAYEAGQALPIYGPR